ncbi:MAG: hypothetical protein AB1393_14210 [Candidatus Edwardsbacteria bacterium]
MAKAIIRITIKQFLDGEHQEELEDKLRDFFEQEGIRAEIFNNATGNSTVTRKEKICTKEP